MLHGEPVKRQVTLSGRNGRTVQLSVNYDNAVAAVERSLRSNNERTRRLVQRFVITRTCSVCHGTRLRPEALASQLGGRNLARGLYRVEHGLRGRQRKGQLLHRRGARLLQVIGAHVGGVPLGHGAAREHDGGQDHQRHDAPERPERRITAEKNEVLPENGRFGPPAQRQREWRRG